MYLIVAISWQEKERTLETKKKRRKKIDDFRSKLKFKLHDITMNKEESVTTKIVKAFSNQSILLQHSIEVDENYDAENYDIFVEIGRIQNEIIKSTKKLTERSS